MFGEPNRSRTTSRIRVATFLIFRRIALIAAVSLIAVRTQADQVVATVTSPDKKLSVELSLTKDGNIAYAVKRGGGEIVARSRLGFILANAPKLDRNFSFGGYATDTHDETWEEPWGERRFVRDHLQRIDGNVCAKVARRPEDGGGLSRFRRRDWFPLFAT